MMAPTEGESAVAAGLPEEILDYYAVGAEAGRLFEGAGELERVRTQDLLLRHIPPSPAVVLDVGGGAGVHSLWLARHGYEVHLCDPVELHVDQAREASAAQAAHPLASCTTGDARDLRFDDTSADAVLLLGPLYHLTDRADRVRALREARRVLRPGGILVAAVISRFASLLSGLAGDLLGDPDFVDIIRRDLSDGQHRNPTDRPYFTTAFFHHPDDLRGEMEEAGFPAAELVAVEGPAMWTKGFADDWRDPARRELILEFLRTTERDPAIIGTGSHFLGIGTA
jgi:ubiquinone/menaquinone biosynthesis C-methylase UbiE